MGNLGFPGAPGSPGATGYTGLPGPPGATGPMGQNYTVNDTSNLDFIPMNSNSNGPKMVLPATTESKPQNYIRVEIYDSNFRQNTASVYGGMIGLSKIQDEVQLNIERTVFRNNQADSAGGVFHFLVKAHPI